LVIVRDYGKGNCADNLHVNLHHGLPGGHGMKEEGQSLEGLESEGAQL